MRRLAMRILIIAYDYPPIQSPRALRWRYLSRELALRGHEVHVLVPEQGAPGVELPQAPGRVVLHRSFPGPFAWLAGTAKRRRLAERAVTLKSAAAPAPAGITHLNWRGRVVDMVKRLAAMVLFPDIRLEWNPWAHAALRRLLVDVFPDVVITSHEPASTLPLGMAAQRAGFAWVADLGDPVCAAYTPLRWRKRALKLEAKVAVLADHIVVTNQPTCDLLVHRHGGSVDRYTVLPNGYDDRRPCGGIVPEGGSLLAFEDARLELIYAGRLYGYRDPTSLLQAIALTPGVRLTVVVPDPPADGVAAFSMLGGDQLRVLGPLSHEQVLGFLERADILINFADRGQPVRTPAKLFEYFGIARPILHIHGDDVEDAATRLLHGLGRGWLCADDASVLAERLAILQARKKKGVLHEGLHLAPLADYAHSHLGRRLERLLEDAVRGGRAKLRPQMGEAPHD